MFAHVDLPRLARGMNGGAFWSAFAPCPKNALDFTEANYVDCKLSRSSPLFRKFGFAQKFSDLSIGNLPRYLFISRPKLSRVRHDMLLWESYVLLSIVYIL
jgi:hypothetical protein